MSRREPVFVVNADDFGMTRPTTEGILRAHREGVVTSASLVVTTPALEHAVNALRSAPELGVGLHFSLSAGSPAAGADRVPDLVDEHGGLRFRFTSVARGLVGPRRVRLLEQIGIELEAQLQRFESHGLRADHLDSERHVHLIPGIFLLAAKVARGRGIRFVRRTDDIGARYLAWRGLGATLRSGGIVKYMVLRAFSRRAEYAGYARGFASTRYATLLYTGRMDLVLPRLFRRPPPGVTEIAVHPGLPAGADTRGLANPVLASYLRSEDRRRELEACLEARSLAGGVRLARFSDLEPES